MRSEIRQPQKFIIVANDDLIQSAALTFEAETFFEEILLDLPNYIPDYSEGYADPVCNWG